MLKYIPIKTIADNNTSTPHWSMPHWCLPHFARHTGARHTGVRHTGARHTGARHTGARHTGPCHTGARHTGARHTGPCHTGARHTGPCHTGARHTGWWLHICYKLLIRPNNCVGDYVYVAFTIIVAFTHAVVFTIIAPFNNAEYVYIVRIHVFVYTYVCIVQKRPSHPIPRPCHAHKADTSPAIRLRFSNITPKKSAIRGQWICSSASELD